MDWIEIVRDLGIFVIVGYFAQAVIGRWQTRFSFIAKKQADVSENLYCELINLERYMSEFLIHWDNLDEERKRELIKKIPETIDAFQDLYLKNEIWFPGEICDEFYKLNAISRGILFHFHQFFQLSKSSFPQDQHMAFGNRLEAWKTFTGNFLSARDTTRGYIRTLLGIPNPSQKKWCQNIKGYIPWCKPTSEN